MVTIAQLQLMVVNVEPVDPAPLEAEIQRLTLALPEGPKRFRIGALIMCPCGFWHLPDAEHNPVCSHCKAKAKQQAERVITLWDGDALPDVPGFKYAATFQHSAYGPRQVLFVQA